jgi:hypothetical protein
MRELRVRAWDTEGRYRITNDGRVISVSFNHTQNSRELKQYLDEDGYSYVVLHIDGKRHKRLVHRMMAERFLEKPTSTHQVNHKNGIRNDNRLENLEYVTPRENTIHGWRVNGRRQSEKARERAHIQFSGENNPKAKMNRQKVDELRNMKAKGASLAVLSATFGISTYQASNIANMRYWK